MTRFTRTAAVVTLAVSSMGLGACANHRDSGQASASASGGAPALISAGKLTMCTHLSYKPFEFKDSAGKVVGFDKDIIDLVSKKLGVTTQVVDIPFEQITSGAAYAAKKCDLGISATTITPSRQAAAPFSDPYFLATQALLTKKTSGIKSLADLKGKKLGVQTDTSGQLYATQNKGQNGYNIVVFEDMPSQLAAVLAGTVDAGINDNDVVAEYAKENPTTAMVAKFNTGEKYGIQFQKGDANAANLMTTVNEVLAAAKKDGTYTEVYKKWFKTAPPAAALQ